MSATNSTPNYELPIFEGTDKPTWQGDFNEAMNKIDNAIDSVDQKSENNKSDISSLRQGLQTLNGSINTLNTDVGNLKTANENKYIAINDNNLVDPNSVGFAFDDITRYIYYNGNSIQVLCSFIVNNLSSGVLAGGELRIPLIKIPRNIFALSTSSITTHENKYLLTTVWLRHADNDMGIYSVVAYYDGTNTVMYLRAFPNATNVPYVFTLNVTSLNAGLTT